MRITEHAAVFRRRLLASEAREHRRRGLDLERIGLGLRGAPRQAMMQSGKEELDLAKVEMDEAMTVRELKFAKN